MQIFFVIVKLQLHILQLGEVVDVEVQFVVDGNTYTKRKWIGAGKVVPTVGSKLKVLYCSNKPSNAKILN